jgi:sensor domain CHASE-containing protein
MRTRNVVVVTAGLLVALVLTVTGAVYAIDQWAAAPLDGLQESRAECQ